MNFEELIKRHKDVLSKKNSKKEIVMMGKSSRFSSIHVLSYINNGTYFELEP